MSKHFRLTILLLMFLFLSACSSSGEIKKVEMLNDAIDNYAYALRWGRIDDAVAYHVAEGGDKPEIDSAIMKSIRVTGFNIKERTINPELTGATVEGELNYYSNEYGTLRSIEYSQRWWYEPESKKWFLDNEFPQFK